MTATLGSTLGMDTVAGRQAGEQLGRILREYQATLTPFFVGPNGQVTAVDVPVSRTP